MPPALSPSGRVRSRTSDISDFLRGRHDPKSSSDLQPPPPVPHLPEQVTPKHKSKFAFLGRKRLPSFSPASAKAEAAAASAAAASASASTGIPQRAYADKDVPPLPTALSSARSRSAK